MYAVTMFQNNAAIQNVSTHKTLVAAVKAAAKANRARKGNNLTEFGATRADGAEISSKEMQAARDTAGL